MNDGYWIVIISGVVAGLIAGHVMFRADYCMVGMLRDLFMFRNATMARFLVVQIFATMVLVEVLRLSGGLPYYPSLLMGPANLTSVLGGFVFGVGMVLSGSCVVGCLYRIGSGSALGICSLLAMIGGALMFAEVAPLWSAMAQSLKLTPHITLPQSLELAAGWVAWPTIAVLAVVVRQWYQRGYFTIATVAHGFIQPWKAALTLSVVTAASLFFTGMPIGITTSYVKIGAWIESLIIPHHVDNTAYLNLQVIDYIPPFASSVIQGGTAPVFDAIAALQLSVIAGILVGAMLSSLQIKEFGWTFRVPLRQYFFAIGGGLLVGLGARMAPGCNVWHLLGGLPLMAWNSMLFALGMLPGTWLGSRILLSLFR